jgi:ABC-type amino acid transport substrate-binding protein
MSIVLTATSNVFAERSILTEEQNAWLDKNKRTVLVRPQESDPPFVFVGSGVTKETKGFSVDYLNAIAKKLDLNIKYSEPALLNQILADAKEGKDGIILSVTPTFEREKYLYFTDSYYDTPAVIAVRKDFSANKSPITLDYFSGKKVAVGDKYAVEPYIQANYPDVDIVFVIDDQAGLQKLLLGSVDAVVMDLASFSYYTQNEVLSYVKVVGQTGFEYKHSIAVPRSSPELAFILSAGLKSLSDPEKQLIINKWITTSNLDLGSKSIKTKEGSNLIPWLTFVGFVVLVVGAVIVISVVNKRRRKIFTHTKDSEVLSELQDEFEELKVVHEELKEDISHIDDLERDIEEKIENIK